MQKILDDAESKQNNPGMKCKEVVYSIYDS